LDNKYIKDEAVADFIDDFIGFVSDVFPDSGVWENSPERT
jgi:hypothetical protein